MERDMRSSLSLCDLPDELLLRVLSFLDVPDLLITSRTSHHLRALSFDPLLHHVRLRYSHDRVAYLLCRRPPLYTLQPPVSTIHLTRTHVAARRLHWSLVCIRLNRSLSRRPKLSTLISANILPKECYKRDRRSGEIVWGNGIAGALVERKRKLEREQIKEGLRVWLERKASEIRSKRSRSVEGEVGVLVWRFTKKVKLADSQQPADQWPEKRRKENLYYHVSRPSQSMLRAYSDLNQSNTCTDNVIATSHEAAQYGYDMM